MDFKNVRFDWFAVFCALFAASLFMPGRKGGDAPQVSVSGECLRKVVKDRTSIVLEVRNLAPDAAAALRKSTATYGGISSFASGLGSVELETTRMDAYDKYEWDAAKKKNVKLGVESVIGLEVSASDGAALESVFAEIAKYKDVYTGGLRTYVSKEKLKAEQDRCLADATLDARAKAEAIAGAAGRRVGRLVSASARQKAGASSPVFYRAKAENIAVMDSAPAPVFSAPEEISVGVSAGFELK